ncbi:brassinosteroid-responsive RING protein 1 [Cryptomeria japonica]|uniref:brassinosteroid-responsive RING protein 1 n=1 Tax=Cryptomeria japonica TaxID=3369 RepID=UPI0027D9E0A0|nr:brassinosteroid-responsive RING protein 1 [Cryptomeria japonica]
MGYPVGCRFMVIPKVLLYSASAMASLNNGICCFLSDLGLCEPPQEEEIYLGQGLPEISSLISSASGEMIKSRLHVITFRNFAEKMVEIEEDFVCPICLSSFQGDDEIRELYNCCHIFHRNCLDKWIDQHQDGCPVCRSPLLPLIQSVDGNVRF